MCWSSYDIPTCLTVHRKRSWAVGGGCCWTIWLQCSYMLWISTTGKKNISSTRQNRTVLYSLKCRTFLIHNVYIGAVTATLSNVTNFLTFSPQKNEWQDDWVSFYSQQKLQHQLNMVENSHGDREARELWAKLQVHHQKQNKTYICLIVSVIWQWKFAYCVCYLQLKIPQFFSDVEVVPALLHGDLWGGNVAESTEGPVIFDPASFYGHSEFELGIAGMFGGFDSSFYSAYHEKIPQAPGFAKRNQLYQLFHYLNHWNHFGGGYRGSSIRIMKNLLI